MRKLLTAVLLLIASSASAGMLTGKTPADVTAPGYVPPAGWSVVSTQDFESGSLPATQSKTSTSEFTTVQKHSGLYAMRGRYAWDAATSRWIDKATDVGPFNEIYVSMWEYYEPQARFNDELHTIRFSKRNPDGTEAMQVVFDIYGGFNLVNGGVWLINEGIGEGLGGYWKSYYGPSFAWGQGTWVQWEVWFKPNTVNIPDGFMRVYQNGTLKYEVTNSMFNGKTDFKNGGVQVEVGGLYTKHVWYMDYPTNSVCSTSYGGGTGYARETNWNNPCACPNQCPPTGYVPIFYRYHDDIIVMKSGGTTGGDVSPPYTNTNSPAKNSTGWPVANRDISFYVRDDTNTTRSTISMTIDGGTALTCASGLTCTPTTSPSNAYLVSYTRGSDWADNTLYSLNIRATDVYSNALNETYTFTTALASPTALAITSTTLPDGTVGTSYSQTLSATGGVSPYTWDNTTALPAGLSISPNTGVVNGTPTVAGGPTTVTFRVTDSASTPATDTQDIDITIGSGTWPAGEIHAVGDTYMISGSTQNFSTGDQMYLYTWPQDTDANHILMKWDLSSVAGTVPTSATLRLYMTGYGGSGGDNTYTATVHRITGVNPTVSAASWATYDGTNAWTGGADGGVADAGAAEASFSIDMTAKYYTIDVTSMVRDWLLDPSTNKGMLILPPGTATVDTNRHFASSENPTAAFQPVLFLSYVPVPSPIQSLTGGILTGGIIQ